MHDKVHQGVVLDSVTLWNETNNKNIAIYLSKPRTSEQSRVQSDDDVCTRATVKRANAHKHTEKTVSILP